MGEISDKHIERAVLVGLVTPDVSRAKAEEYLDELSFLVHTAGGEEITRFVQQLSMPDPKFFVGSGKIEEIKEYVEAAKAEMLVFDDELSPSQLRNIERLFKDVKILDRTNLILDIFASRARTSHAMVQVELAQYQYLLPRLTRMWTHLERQRGGIGMRGPGETEIETDRRIIRDRIALLKKKLTSIDKQMATQRKNRGKLVRVALVGYTNVGKSTIMNMLSKSDVFAENKLFATLDTTVRKVVVHNLPFLVADTVGFIRKLPHHLVESFKSTLDEVREADVLLHVVDISHPDYEDHVNVVRQTLGDLKASDKPTIMIFNKIDAYKAPEEEEDFLPVHTKDQSLDALMKHWMAKENMPAIFISARTRQNLDEFRKLLYEQIKDIHAARFPFNEFLFQDYVDEDVNPL